MYIFPLNWVVVKKTSSTSWVGMCNRVLSRFFVQAGHETTHTSSGNKHFFTITGHRQQKLSTFLENKVS